MTALLSLSHGGGCGCKLSPTELGHVLDTVRRPSAGERDGVLRGLLGLDDAAVVQWAGDALVLTCDFFTPVVDDPRAWGRIAAANALSDIYAMGGSPRFALNILAWPRNALPAESLAAVLEGGLSALDEAGAVLVGGHSIEDPEPKYGMAVIGEVDPQRMLRTDAGAAGDVLVLTKPLGVGVVVTAAKHGLAAPPLIDAAVACMATLNRRASQIAVGVGLRAATDVTGFGLVGHAHNLAAASGLSAELRASLVPRLPGIDELLDQGLAPSGTARNIAASESSTVWPALERRHKELLCDPQSSGGLLLSVPVDSVERLLAELHASGPSEARIVGRLVDGRAGEVRVRA